MSRTNSPLGPGVPNPGDILAGSSIANNGTILTIPAGRVWAGWVSINAVLAVAASGAAVQSRATVSIAGSSAAPAAGVLIGVFVAVAAQPSSSAGQVANSDRTFVTISAGSSAATLTLQVNNASAASATASGVLVA